MNKYLIAAINYAATKPEKEGIKSTIEYLEQLFISWCKVDITIESISEKLEISNLLVDFGHTQNQICELKKQAIPINNNPKIRDIADKLINANTTPQAFISKYRPIGQGFKDYLLLHEDLLTAWNNCEYGNYMIDILYYIKALDDSKDSVLLKAKVTEQVRHLLSPELALMLDAYNSYGNGTIPENEYKGIIEKGINLRKEGNAARFYAGYAMNFEHQVFTWNSGLENAIYHSVPPNKQNDALKIFYTRTAKILHEWIF